MATWRRYGINILLSRRDYRKSDGDADDNNNNNNKRDTKETAVTVYRARTRFPHTHSRFGRAAAARSLDVQHFIRNAVALNERPEIFFFFWEEGAGHKHVLGSAFKKL